MFFCLNKKTNRTKQTNAFQNKRLNKRLFASAIAATQRTLRDSTGQYFENDSMVGIAFAPNRKNAQASTLEAIAFAKSNIATA